MQDGVFWQFLAYCAGVGGSMLIIGSRRRSRRDGPGADQFHLVLEEYLAAGLGGIFVWCGGIYSPEFDIIISV